MRETAMLWAVPVILPIRADNPLRGQNMRKLVVAVALALFAGIAGAPCYLASIRRA
jgi:hypothetical protein